MVKSGLKFSFSLRMKMGLCFLLVCTTLRIFAQDKQDVQQKGNIEGIVFDNDTKERVARTNIVNTRTKVSIYNDLKGSFKIDGQTGDVLIFTRTDYLPDTVKLTSEANIVIYLRRTAIPLREVTIRDSFLNPEQQLLNTKKEYSKAYGPNGNNDMLSSSPGSGAGISIDALYNAFSRSGRNAAHLQQIIQQDYQQNVISYRFNRTFVGYITGLKDKELADFMYKYRPGYYTVTHDTDYEFITYIRNNLKRFMRNKRVYMQPLVPSK